MNKVNKDVIELYENSDQISKAAIDRIVVEIFNRRTDSKTGQAVLLTGCSPLAGTTSTCISLAIAVANTKRKTLLVDCDMRKALQYKKLNEATTVGLSDYLMQTPEVSESLDDIVYKTNVEELYYIPCGGYNFNATRILCSVRMKELISKVKDQYDCIIFDLPSIAIVPDAQILFGDVDGIVLLAALGETRKKQIKDAKRKVSGFADNYYGMIVNKVEKDIYRRDIRDYDYYFVDKRGRQKLTGKTRKKYDKLVKKENE